MPIEVRDLSHVYAVGSPFESVAVKHVSVTIADGDLVGLIGHTGSGKSTLIQHLNALLKPTSGTVLVDGQDLFEKGADLRALRCKVGLVFQYPEYQLFEETVIKDISFGPKNQGLSPDEIASRAREAARMVGIGDELLEKSPFELSGGQKRRVAIAGVLAMRPQMLVLDEPAAGLDPSGRREMIALLRSLHDEGGLTLVMVSHSMTDVAQLCNRVLVMNKGELVLDGTPGEVFSRADELEEMGLGLPRAAELARRLRREGFGIPQGIWRTDEVEKAIVAQLRGQVSQGKGGAQHG